MRSIILAVLLMTVLSGCATVSTAPLSAVSNGVTYALPKGKMRLEVVEASGVLSVTLGGPVVIGDPDTRLVAHLPQSGTADNNVTVTVDSKTQLLQKVDVVSTGELTTIATNLAKSFAMLQSGTEAIGIKVFSGAYDFADLPAGAEAANAKIAEYYASLCNGPNEQQQLPFAKQVAKLTTKPIELEAILSARLTRCVRMQLAGADTASARALITITVGPPGAPPVANATAGGQTPAPTATRRCAAGICYRPFTVRSATLDVKGAFRLTDLFLIPDERSLVLVDLPAGVFAEQKYTLEFSDGVLTRYQRQGKSELVGLTALPIEMLKAVLSAPVEALGLNQKGLEAQTSYLGTVDKLTAQQQTTAVNCAKAGATCPRTAFKLIGGAISGEATAGAPGDTGGTGAPANGPAAPPPAAKAPAGPPPDNG